MIFSIAAIFSLFYALTAHAQTSCTTLQPVFELPLDATSTVFDTTVTSTSSVDCSGCSLVVSTFRAVINTSVPATPTATTTQPATTSESYVCSPSATNITSTTSAPAVVPTPTASPLPPINSTAQAFIDQLSTAILYASLYGNDGDQIRLCALINPSALSAIKNPNINGTAVQTEVCALAAIQVASPALARSIEDGNRVAVTYLAQALFAVQVAGGYAGGTDLDTLCSEIETELINGIFVKFVDDEGTAIKNYVCGAAAAQRRRLAK